MRASYIKQQREAHGRPAVAVLPFHYPKELLTAAGVLAVELWGPPGGPAGPDAGRIQAYVCPLVRNAFAFCRSGKMRVDAMLCPHTCDSMQGLATLLRDSADASATPIFHFQPPKGEARASGRSMLLAELRQLDGLIRETLGRTATPAGLRDALELHREIDDLRGRLLRCRRRVPFEDAKLYELLRRGEFLWPTEHRDELRDALSMMKAEPSFSGRVPVMLSGIVPEPSTLFDALENAGALVVADDYAAVGRRLPSGAQLAETSQSAADRARSTDAFVELADRLEDRPPCPTRGSDTAARLAYLDRLLSDSRAHGLIMHTVKFCEPELFDVPSIMSHFRGRDVPVLHIESELERELSAQTLTRLEAFVESIATRQQRSTGSPGGHS